MNREMGLNYIFLDKQNILTGHLPSIFFLNAIRKFYFAVTDRQIYRLTIPLKCLALFSTQYPGGTDQYRYLNF